MLGSRSENPGVTPRVWQGAVALYKVWFIRGISGICPNKLKIRIADVLCLTVASPVKL